MSEENQPQARTQPQSAPSISIGNVDTHGGDLSVMGDNIKDNSQGKTHNEVHGDVENLTSNQTNEFSEMSEQFTKLISELSQQAPEITEQEIQLAIPEMAAASADEPVARSGELPKLPPLEFEEIVSEDLPVFENNEDHPAVVSRMASQYSENGHMTSEEQKSFFQRMYSSVIKYATSRESIAVSKVVIAGMKALVATPPPFHVIIPAVEMGIKLASGDE